MAGGFVRMPPARQGAPTPASEFAGRAMRRATHLPQPHDPPDRRRCDRGSAAGRRRRRSRRFRGELRSRSSRTAPPPRCSPAGARCRPRRPHSPARSVSLSPGRSWEALGGKPGPPDRGGPRAAHSGNKVIDRRSPPPARSPAEVNHVYIRLIVRSSRGRRPAALERRFRERRGNSDLGVARGRG